MNDNKQAGYHSYLLRLWREGSQDPWRASLQSTATEQLYHFADLERLWAFIQTLLAAGGEIEQAPVESPRQEDHPLKNLGPNKLIKKKEERYKKWRKI